MKIQSFSKADLVIVVPLIFYSFFVNFFSANIGVMPIDTFGFFDSGYSILLNKLPVRDYWITTGIVVDYLQSIFFFYFWHPLE